MNLWLDDMRKNPEDWLWVKDYRQAVEAFETLDVVNASLDHDLYMGDYWDYDEHYFDKTPTGYDVVLWIAEHDAWPETLAIHSDNMQGVRRMQEVIEEFGPYTDKGEVAYDHTGWYVGGPKYT